MSYVQNPSPSYAINDGDPHNYNRQVVGSRLNRFWNSWGWGARILGLLLAFFGICMIPIEVARIISGSLNRGFRGSYYLYPNYNTDANSNSSLVRTFLADVFQGGVTLNPTLAQKGIVPFSAFGANAHNFPIQDKYLWPWSHPATFFCFLIIAAGILGILSSCRRTYTTVFIFYVLSLGSFLFSIFLLAYFITEVFASINARNQLVGAFYRYYVNYALSSVMLALTVVTLLLSLLATLYSALGAGVCSGAKAGFAPALKINRRMPMRNVGTRPQEFE